MLADRAQPVNQRQREIAAGAVAANRDAVGARLTYKSGDLTRTRMKTGGGSFLSSHDPRVLLGVGKRTKIDSLDVQWPQPGGSVEHFTNLPVDRYITIVEGTGKWK